MNQHSSISYLHACPRNCYSACSMVSKVVNGRLVHLDGDPHHAYSSGKLCSKGYAYIERNNHPKRLKYPYYRKSKNDKFSPITWEKAYNLIINQLVTIYETHKNFSPLALYKYSGNLGVLQYVTDEFFSSLGRTTRIAGAPCLSAGLEALSYQTGAVKMSDPSQITKSDLIILWGANPANTNIHLIPIIDHAKAKGAKIVVIDPMFTKTAEFAHLYIQLQPSTDGALANALVKALYEKDAFDQGFLSDHSIGFDDFFKEINKRDQANLLFTSGVTEEAVEVLVAWLQNANAVSHIIGFGMQRHSNGGQNIRAIEALAAFHGDIGKLGGGIFYAHTDFAIFDNQQLLNEHDRLLNMNKWIEEPKVVEGNTPIEMMWIACRNPISQDPKPQSITKQLEKIPFVVTVDQFMTPTAEASHLVLPTTTLFEQMDIVTSYWHKEISINEQAIPPFYESRSEWNIMTEMANRLNEYQPGICSFPIYSAEEEYLNHQFNDKVYQVYRVKSISDLRKKDKKSHNQDMIAWEDRRFPTASGKFQFYSPEAKEHGFPATPAYVDGLTPSKSYPYWLITPHHPYKINSQFHFLTLTEDDEARVEIHEETAKELGIFNGEVIKVFNDQGEIAIKALYSWQVPKDILLIYEGWYPNSRLTLNSLIPVLETDMGENLVGANGIAYYDTFVNIAKL